MTIETVESKNDLLSLLFVFFVTCFGRLAAFFKQTCAQISLVAKTVQIRISQSSYRIKIYLI